MGDRRSLPTPGKCLRLERSSKRAGRNLMGDERVRYIGLKIFSGLGCNVP